MSPSYYKPSGTAPPAGVLLTLVLGLVSAVLLSFAYVYLVWYIPFIYLNMLFTLGFGMGLVGFLVLGVRSGKIRSSGVVMIIGVLTGLVALYLQWVVWATLVTKAGHSSSFLGIEKLGYVRTHFSLRNFMILLGSPGTVWEIITGVNPEGLWGIGGTNVSGVFLWIVWALEAFVIVGLPSFVAGQFAIEPFSEHDNAWMKEKKLLRILPAPVSIDELKLQLEQGNFALLEAEPLPNNQVPGWNIVLHDDYAGREHYLTVKAYTPADKNKNSTVKLPASRSSSIDHLAVSKEVHDRLLARLA